MGFTNNDIEQVLEYWQDISQDPEYISEKTGINIINVLNILEELQTKGNILGFSKIERRKIDENKILLFEELLDAEISKSLKIGQFEKNIKDKRYFYDEKNIDEVYDAHTFDVTVRKIHYKSGLLIIPLIVNFKNNEFNLFMVYSSNDDISYGSKEGEIGVQKLKNALGEENMEMFDAITGKILDDHIPDDFWEVRNRQN
jgi:hypothetical protein